MIANFLVGASLLTLSTLSDSHQSAQFIGPILAAHAISLENRQPDRFVNGVFKDNILLNLSYMSGNVRSKSQINWEDVTKSQYTEFKLNPGEAFAFHDDLLPKYQGKVVKTSNAHFNFEEGFKSDGYLMGDGVCHFASLINWVAKDASLMVEAPTNHNFATINEVPAKYGVSIYNNPGQGVSDQRQNLYITNNYNKPVTFQFTYQANILSLAISI